MRSVVPRTRRTFPPLSLSITALAQVATLPNPLRPKIAGARLRVTIHSAELLVEVVVVHATAAVTRVISSVTGK